MADPRITQLVIEVELEAPRRITQLVIEVELEAPRKITQQVIEVELIPGPQATQVMIEVDISSESIYGLGIATQAMLEVDLTNAATRHSQVMLEVDVSDMLAWLYADSFYLAATKVAPATTQDHLFLRARIQAPFTQQLDFSLRAQIEAVKEFDLMAKIRLPTPLVTVYYDDFDGPYEIRLLDHDGNLLHVIDQYTEVEFVRAVNGQWHSGYGWFRLTGAASLLPVDDFTLDRIIQVRRLSSTGPVVVFEGFHRFTKVWNPPGKGVQMFMSSGPDLKHLAKRRIVIPFPADRAFFSISGPFTDTMRHLISLNATSFAGVDRAMARLRVQSFDHLGVPLNLHFRYTPVHEELENLAQVGEGADWDINQNGAYIDFDVFYPFKGKDRRRNGVQGWPEMVWSIDRATLVEPAYEEDRVDEITVTYVGGEGIGADREILVRTNIASRDEDSPWNRIETFIEASKETSLASLAALGDAYNVEHGLVRLFELRSAPKEVLSYGSKWNLGDICTGEYTHGGVFDMRIVAVREKLNRETGITVEPVFFIYPRLEDY
ncbi:hypothetical protein LCGC14_0275160 [marine sediment metagenome]|uniref:Gp28/Gp37-like domain-containing protein n=1 Tax=marine sediment metagenome TaxID=412755 RepID=A0A0F9WIC8_9ZZZZ